MLHQTLLSFQPLPPPSPSSSSSFLFSLPSSSSSSPALPFPDGLGRPLLYPPPALRPCSPQTAEMETVREMFVAEEMDERGNLLGEDFQVDDLLDLRNLPESEEEDEQMDPRAATESSFSPPQNLQENEPLQLYSDITIHETDAASLEWLSRFFDDCSKECSSPPRPGLCCHPGSGSSEAAPPLVPDIPVKAKRSKRIRGSGTVWSRSGGPVRLPDSSPASSSITSFGSTSPSPSSSASSSSFNSYYIAYEPLPPFTGFLLEEGSSVLSEEAVRPKKRGRKPKNASSSPPAERRCAHCGVSKTPQWRAGPLGAKTLCNACGVRFKSGRLLPEYRPACSPTFVSSVHSNSHRKVLEMRRKKVEQLIVHSAPPVPSF